MNFTELNQEEFESFAYKHKLFSFHQTKEWAKLKEYNGWKNVYVGLKDNDKLVAAALILTKQTPVKRKIFYSPRGFLIDYDNKELLETFTTELKKYAKKNKALFIKIDPYLIYKQRDMNAEIVEGGIDNSKAIDNLKSLGYKHYGLNKEMKELQPRWIYVLNINGKSEEEIFNDFSKDTKRYINRCEKQGLVVEEIGLDKIDEFKKIMEHTSKRRGFIDRPISYYKEMLETLGEHIKILSCYLDTDKWISNLDNEKAELDKQMNEVEEKLSINPDSKKSKDMKRNLEKSIEDLNKKYEEVKSLKEKYGNKVHMASSMFIIYPNEVLYLYSGSFDEFMKYNPQYLIQWEIIKYTIKNNIPKYNFYGIDGNFDKNNNEMYGIYEFKRGFGGNVEEFIGEFDLVISKFMYFIYKVAFKFYKGIKNIKNGIKKK